MLILVRSLFPLKSCWKLLFSYNQRRRDVDVLDIAFRRAFAVTIGVLWAAIISRLLWPAEARRELSNALGELSLWSLLQCCKTDECYEIPRFCLNLGWLYTRLVASNSSMREPHYERSETNNQPGADTVLSVEESNAHVCDSVEEFMAMYAHCYLERSHQNNLVSGSCICKSNWSRCKGYWLKRNMNLASKGHFPWGCIAMSWSAYSRSLISFTVCDALLRGKDGMHL
jgi:hypothetical protein